MHLDSLNVLQRPAVTDGCCDEKSIADRFASVFQSLCVPNTVERHQQLLAEFTQRFHQYSGHNFGNDIISVELVEQCICKLKKGKAAGFDGISADTSHALTQSL